MVGLIGLPKGCIVSGLANDVAGILVFEHDEIELDVELIDSRSLI